MEANVETMTEAEVREVLREVLDPEVGVNIIDLGLVYGVGIEGRRIRVEMTVTSPACPLGEFLVEAVEGTLRARLPSAEDVEVQLVFDPPWTPARMSDAARAQLGLPPA